MESQQKVNQWWITHERVTMGHPDYSQMIAMVDSCTEEEFLVHFEFQYRLSASTPISESMPRLASTRVAVGIPTTDSE